MTPEELDRLERRAREITAMCFNCTGRGYVRMHRFDNEKTIDCPKCNGRGEVPDGEDVQTIALVAEVRRLRAEVASLRTELALSRRTP